MKRFGSEVRAHYPISLGPLLCSKFVSYRRHEIEEREDDLAIAAARESNNEALITDLKTEIARMKHVVNTLEMEVNEKAEAAQTLKSEIETMAKDFSVNSEYFLEIIQDKTDVIDNMKIEVDDVKHQLVQARQMKEDTEIKADEAILEFKAEIDELKYQLNQKVTDEEVVKAVVDFEQVKDSLNAEICELEQEAAETKGVIEMLEYSNKQMVDANEKLKKQLDFKTDNEKQLFGMLDSVKAFLGKQNDDLKQELHTKTAAFNKVKADLEDINKKLESEVQAQKKQIDEMVIVKDKMDKIKEEDDAVIDILSSDLRAKTASEKILKTAKEELEAKVTELTAMMKDGERMYSGRLKMLEKEKEWVLKRMRLISGAGAAAALAALLAYIIY